MPTADAAKYAGSGRKQRRSCSRDVAPLKQTSLHRLMIKLTDIRNVLNVIEEMPCERFSTGAAAAIDCNLRARRGAGLAARMAAVVSHRGHLPTPALLARRKYEEFLAPVASLF